MRKLWNNTGGAIWRCLNRLVKSSEDIEYTERILLEDGTLIHEEAPYRFARLFKDGQEFVMFGKTMRVISCKVNGRYVDTIVSI